MDFCINVSLKHKSGIYIISNSIDDRIYIGSTINFDRRFKDHRSKLINKTHANKYLQSFSNKYGIDKLSFNLLFLCKNTCLKDNEKHWIDLLEPKFNIKKIIERRYFQDQAIFNTEMMCREIDRIDKILMEKHKNEYGI
jgi:group I intron endonuclease